MARLQLAAGAREVMTLHETPLVDPQRGRHRAPSPPPPSAPTATRCSPRTRWAAPRWARTRARSVVDSRGRHHQLENLWIADGSVFPTSLGVNPQLSVYAHARLFATEIAKAG